MRYHPTATVKLPERSRAIEGRASVVVNPRVDYHVLVVGKRCAVRADLTTGSAVNFRMHGQGLTPINISV